VVRAISPIFVGRTAELAALDGALESARQGVTTTVVIGGDAGVGKTRLLATWSEGARGRGARVITGSCLDLGESGPGYSPVVQALRDLIGGLDPVAVDDLLGSDRTVLTRVLPEVATERSDRDTSQPLAQIRLFDRLVDILERAASSEVVILQLDDLQWADPSTRAFILYLLEVSNAACLLIVGTYRAESVGPEHPFRSFLDQVLRRPNVRAVALPPFTRDEVRDQLTGILGSPPSERFLDLIATRSEGNALFTEELVAAGATSADLPRSIADGLAARFSLMPAAAADLLRLASVAGRTISYDVLRASTSISDAELADSLRRVARANIMEPVAAIEGYRFRHALLQEAIYQDTVPGERRRLHTSVALALEADLDQTMSRADRASLLAHHWYRAGNPERTFAASIDAGDRAAARSAHGEALRHLERALEVWGNAPAASSRLDHAELLQRSTRQAFLAGDPDRALKLGRQGLDELGPDGDPVLRVRLLDDLSLALEALTLEEEAENCRVALAELNEADLPAAEQTLVLDARSLLARMRYGDYERSATAARQMLAVAEAAGDDRLKALANLTIGWHFADVAAYDEALAHARVAQELAVSVGETDVAAEAQRLEYEVLWSSAAYDEALLAARAAQDHAARVGLGQSMGPRAAWIEADSLRALGRLSESARVVESALLDEPVRGAFLVLHTAAAEVAIARGSLEDATDHLEAAHAPDVTYPRGYFAAVSVALATADGRPDDARAIALATGRQLADVKPYDPAVEDLWWLVEAGLASEAERAERARAAGDEGAAGDAREAARTLHGFLLDFRALAATTGIRDTGVHRGRELLIAGHLARIEDRDSADIWAAAASEFPPSSVEALTARYRQAEAMVASGAPRVEIAAVVAPAHAAAAEIGARPLAQLFEALARRVRVDLRLADATAAPTDADATPPDETPGSVALRRRGLSNREIEVLTLVAAGYSNAQIAERLFISSKTASVHVSHILDKLGVTSRTEAATVGVRLGLPEVDDDS
jgi:DNA-binding CsgD family transcriptional regulator